MGSNIKLPNIIQKMWYNNNNIRIGINNAKNNNFDNLSVLITPRNCVIENVGIPVYKNQIIASLYNDDTRCEYLFYSPIKGTIVTRNQSIIDNLQLIYSNKTNDNWLVEIEPCKKEEEILNNLKSKYYWFY